MNHVDHIEHIEDLPILDGYAGALRACDYLQSAGEWVLGKEPTRRDDISIKYDGSFSFIAGWDPRDDKFFVAKKSVFNKEPVYYKSREELDNYGLPEDLRYNLFLLHKYLPAVIKTGIFQGDFMYKNMDLKRRIIHGHKVTSFRANTLVYTLSDEAANFWEERWLGVALHTAYDGHPGNLVATHFCDNNLKGSMAVFQFPRSLGVNYNPSGPFSMDSITKLRGYVAHQGGDLNVFFWNREFPKLYKQWMNWSYKTNNHLPFTWWLDDYFKKELENRKTKKGKAAVQTRYDEQMFLAESKSFKEVQERILKPLTGLKHKLITHLNKRTPFGVYYESTDGTFVNTSHEGYVITDEYGMRPAKLVNRRMFSRLNDCNDVVHAWDR
jgi:hypothetical protein